MTVAVYCPLKPPDHPVPSGDRRVARLLIAALETGGHAPVLAARLRSYDRGDPVRQARLARIGSAAADRLIRRFRARPPRAWLTYHLYHKAPDAIGPRVAAGLGIPYLAAEASVAPKRADGPWASGHASVVATLRRADGVIFLNPVDRGCVVPLLPPQAETLDLAPFLDTAPYDRPRDRAALRAHLARTCGLDADLPWSLAVGMMRDGDKRASYDVLGAAAARLPKPPVLLIVGDGPARPAVEAACAGPQVRYLGARDEGEVAEIMAACDLLVWPAIGEAFGMALLEAQASGLPVLAGRTGGVPQIVADGETGVLVPVGDVDRFAAAWAALVAAPARLAALGARARAKVARDHALPAAARHLTAFLDRAAPLARKETA